ncbi:unnamed protein product [Rhizoctonia solani]|uniref:Uncharacterized protein n=1 Tax=Rhizoctonia solani TaxID=456999 RepID=A0A8H2WKW0_9AGAM|nr:unnamed protein product [Rhizoctonia solani]
MPPMAPKLHVVNVTERWSQSGPDSFITNEETTVTLYPMIPCPLIHGRHFGPVATPCATPSLNPSTNFTQDHDRTPPTRQLDTSFKPRIPSTPSVSIEHHYGNYELTPRDSIGEQRGHRTLSLEYHPLFTTQAQHLDDDNLASAGLGSTTEAAPGSGEKINNLLETFLNAPSTASGLGYDGTKPIAYIEIPNPQFYLPSPANDAPDPQSQDITISKGIPKSSTSEQVRSQNGVQELLPDKTIYTMSSNSRSNEEQSSPTKPQNHASNYPRLAKTYCSISAQADLGQVLSEGGSTNQVERTDKIIPYNDDAIAHSTGGAQFLSDSMVVQVFDSADPDYILRTSNMQQNDLQGQVVPENSAAHTHAPTQTLNQWSGTNQILTTPQVYCPTNAVMSVAECPEYFATPHSPRCPTPNQSHPTHCQPSPPRNSPLHYATHVRPQNSPMLVTTTEFQSTSVLNNFLNAPAPQRYFAPGASLTPDPPQQSPNIDLPRRPRTSSPAAPNERPRFLSATMPNTGRRVSDQSWQLYRTRCDRIQLPSLPPGCTMNTNHVGDNYSLVPQNSRSLPHRAPTRGQAQRGGNFISNYGPAPEVDVSNHGSLTNNARVIGAGEAQNHKSASPALRRRQPGQQHQAIAISQSQLGPGLNRNHEGLRTQSEPEPPTIQSKNAQGQVNQQIQVPNHQSSTRVLPSATEQNGSGTKTAPKRRRSRSSADGTEVVKKQKVTVENPEAARKQSDALTMPSQGQQQGLSIARQDCVYFDVNSWRSSDTNITNQLVPQSISSGANPSSQLQDDHDRDKALSLAAQTENSSETAMGSSEPSQEFCYDGGVVPAAMVEGWWSELQCMGERAGGFDHMGWDLSASNSPLDQQSAFTTGVYSGSRALDQCATILDPLERPAPEAAFPSFGGLPNDLCINHLPQDYYSWNVPSAVA